MHVIRHEDIPTNMNPQYFGGSFAVSPKKNMHGLVGDQPAAMCGAECEKE
jgi:hypothetical protein